MVKAQIIGCPDCGATGERYNGYWWTGADCWLCEGRAEVLVIDERTYPLAGATGSVYRNDRGRFAKIPQEALITKLDDIGKEKDTP